MKKLAGCFVLMLCFVLSGCTIVQYTYLRNLSEKTADVYFDLNTASVKAIPDSLYIPFSAMSHPVNNNTYKFMTDSIKVRRYTGTTLLLQIPSGGMVMFDKSTLKKIGCIAPEKIKVALPGKDPYTVRVVGPAQNGERLFQTKGNSPKIYWHDVY